jgi:hypothetical protein
VQRTSALGRGSNENASRFHNPKLAEPEGAARGKPNAFTSFQGCSDLCLGSTFDTGPPRSLQRSRAAGPRRDRTRDDVLSDSIRGNAAKPVIPAKVVLAAALSMLLPCSAPWLPRPPPLHAGERG